MAYQLATELAGGQITEEAFMEIGRTDLKLQLDLSADVDGKTMEQLDLTFARQQTTSGSPRA